MTDNIVFEAEPNARGRYRVEVWDGEMWLRVGQDYGYDDLGEAKQIASYHAWQWGDKTRVVDTQPETMAVDAQNGAQDTTPAETGTIPHPTPETPPEGRTVTFAGFPFTVVPARGCNCPVCRNEPTSDPCESEPVSDPDSFGEYQEQAKVTAVFTHDRALEYLALGLTSEAGEVAGKVKKIIRDHDSVLTRELRDDLASEVGDVLWYVAVLAGHLGFDLSDVADLNIRKLQDRQARGVLGGSGDDR